MSHKLDLLDNAMDSLEEALKKFEEGDGESPRVSWRPVGLSQTDMTA